MILREIEAIHRESRMTYGSPRIHDALKGAGMAIGRKRVARLMRSHRIKARCARIYRRNPGRNVFYTGMPNRSLDHTLSAPNQVWLGDITYLRVGHTWRYLAVVLDKCSRKVLGWRLGSRKSSELTGEALDCAVRRRRPPAGVIFHTDRGIEYGAYDYRERLARFGFVQSMNRPGTLNDNARMESFFHSLKAEGVHGTRFTNEGSLRAFLSSYIQFYNNQRAHSGLGYRTPTAFERECLGQLGVN
jgi:transposase InsO family protein